MAIFAIKPPAHWRRRSSAHARFCSLMGQGRRLGVERSRRFRVSAFSTCSWALDGVSWVQSGSVEIAVGQAGRMLQNRRRHLLPPSGVAPLGSSVRPPVWLRRVELGAVSQHGMHDDGEASGKRDPCLAHRRSFANREGPVLELQRRLVARQHDIGGFV